MACLSAQDAQPIAERINHGLNLMLAADWEETLKVQQSIIDEEGQSALAVWGPMFGSVYYRKGICELKLHKWNAAMESFRICRESFPNVKGAISHNEFYDRSLLGWADAAIGAEDWGKAIQLMDQFFKERQQPGEKFSVEDYFKKKAMCYDKLGLKGERDKALEALHKYRQGDQQKP